ncbi:LysR substrate-binding domain-containing protein [Corynebacterium sp. NPDC060344]|uniref:LysR substrate-binding domain-containing protein n=1 Tax=Corynebacterium sp. NPDC060344 TaxID=3347101 RepID=UPI00365335E0
MSASPPPPDRPLHLTAFRILAAVDELGGLGAAARRLGMAQPNASRTIAALERELGAALLERGPRGSAPTPTGRAVLAAAGPLFDAVDQFHRELDHITGTDAAPLRVTASMTVAEHLVPAWLATYRARHPEAEVGLQVRNSDRVFDDVVSGACDIGFVETPLARRDLHATVVAEDHLVVIVAPGHPWAETESQAESGSEAEPGSGSEPGRKRVSAAELAATPLVLREPGSGTRAFFDRAMAPWNPVPPAVELGSNAAVAATVRAGGEPGVLSELAIADALAHGDLVAVDVDERLDFRRHIRAVWRGAGGPGRAAGELVAIASS